MKIDSNVFIEIRDATTKEVVDTRESHNLVVNTGLNWVRDLIGGTEVRPSFIALGTGTAAPAAGDTDLGSKVYTGAIDRRIASTAKMTNKIFVDSDSANSASISEMGLLRGTLLIARALISPAIAKTSLVELTISHEITVSN